MNNFFCKEDKTTLNTDVKTRKYQVYKLNEDDRCKIVNRVFTVEKLFIPVWNQIDSLEYEN